MQSVARRLADIKSAQRWDFDYHDPAYTKVVESLDRCYPTVRFGDIITLLTDMGAFSLYKTEFFVDDGVPFLRVQNVQEYGVDLTRDTKYISQEYHQQLKKSQLQPGDLLLTTKAVIGVATVVQDDLGECNMSQNLVRIHVTDGVNPHYLAAFLNSRLGRVQTVTAATGPNQQYLNFERIRNLKITLPPHPIQDRIAQVMQNAYVERRKKLAQAEKEIIQSEQILADRLEIRQLDKHFDRAFLVKVKDIITRMDVHHHLPQFTEKLRALKSIKYPLVKIDNIAEGIFNGATPRTNSEAYIEQPEEGIPFIRVTDITDFSVHIASALRIRIDIHEGMLKRSQVRPGDVLLSMAGTIGVAAVVPNGIREANINQAIAAIRPKPDVIPGYLEVFLNSWMGKFQTTRLSRPVVQANINLSEIREILIPIPPEDLQHEVVTEIQSHRKKAQCLRAEAEAVVAEAKAYVERVILGQEEVPL